MARTQDTVTETLLNMTKEERRLAFLWVVRYLAKHNWRCGAGARPHKYKYGGVLWKECRKLNQNGATHGDG